MPTKTKKSKKPALDVADIVLDQVKVDLANQKSAKSQKAKEEEIQGEIALESPHVSVRF